MQVSLACMMHARRVVGPRQQFGHIRAEQYWIEAVGTSTDAFQTWAGRAHWQQLSTALHHMQTATQQTMQHNPVPCHGAQYVCAQSTQQNSAGPYGLNEGLQPD